ncbi:MAG TPA: GNAT family N-acetyltransferase [Candidatus Dormibacteraeota bacterium]
MIRTERLELRLPAPEDAAEIARFYRDNRAHLEPWSPDWPFAFLTEEYWRDQAEQRAQENRAGLGARMFVYKLSDPARVIGNVSLTQVARGALQQCVLGYALAEDEQGHGYMLEAVLGAVRYAFEELGLHRVSASHMPNNERSARLLKKAGFETEGYSREYLLIHGRWEDHVNTALVNPDWKPSPT